MSKTFAVSRYSGGWSRSVWIDRRPALRSRLSWARLILIWLARARASIRWFSERSGAVELLAGVGRVPGRVAVVMGGESTHQREAIKANRRNSPGPQVEVDRHRGWWTVQARPQRSVNADLRRVFGAFHIRAGPSKRLSAGRASAVPALSEAPLAIPATTRIRLCQARSGCPPRGRESS